MCVLWRPALALHSSHSVFPLWWFSFCPETAEKPEVAHTAEVSFIWKWLCVWWVSRPGISSSTMKLTIHMKFWCEADLGSALSGVISFCSKAMQLGFNAGCCCPLEETRRKKTCLYSSINIVCASLCFVLYKPNDMHKDYPTHSHTPNNCYSFLCVSV